VSGLARSDDRLARLAAGGDEAAFATIYYRHGQALYRYCLSILREREDAQDALQSTMERALRSIGAQRTPGGLRAWLFSIAHNEAQRTLAKRPGRADREARAADGGAFTAAAEASALGDGPATSSAATEAAARERLRQLMEDLGELPSQQRSALVLRELSGLESEEIATALGISAAAARQSVYEARVALTTLAQGRDMSCASVQEQISDGDGRRLRGRRMRAHLRDCAICQAFRAGIGSRTVDLPLLFPPLAATAAAQTLAATAGGAGGSDGSTAGAVGPQPSGGSLRERGSTAAAAVLLLLALVGALAAIRAQDPDTQRPPATQAAPAAEPQRAAAPKAKPELVPTPPERTSNPSSLAGYTQLDPSVVAVLGDRETDGASAGNASTGGQGGSLAFTGLDVLTLVLAGAALLGLGLLSRRLSSSRSA
jgi:RNA polymerase sigma factor (sigma-70 family)